MNNWKDQALTLATTTTLSWRKIAKVLEVPKSSVSDFLREKISAKNEKPSLGKTHIFLPDAQVRDGVDLSFLEWQGKYIADKMPDVVVCAGDFADMPSLSSYDKGKRTAEGKRVQKDIDATQKGMELLMSPIHQKMKECPNWNPRLVLTLGNHEERIMRHVNANPELDGFLSYDSLGYKAWGWEVYDYLEPVVVDGITYVHYFANPMTGKPYGGTAANVLQKVGMSITQGHRQCLDVATRTLHNGQHQWSIIAGASYLHNEGYKGYTGNKHWRGIIVKHNVCNGSYDPLFVSMDYLKKRYAV